MKAAPDVMFMRGERIGLTSLWVPLRGSQFAFVGKPETQRLYPPNGLAAFQLRPALHRACRSGVFKPA